MNKDDYCPICEHDFCMCPETLNITITCKMCKKTYTIVVTTAQKNELDKPNRKHIQEILPTHTADERELLISQICGKCWDKMFK